MESPDSNLKQRVMDAMAEADRKAAHLKPDSEEHVRCGCEPSMTRYGALHRRPTAGLNANPSNKQTCTIRLSAEFYKTELLPEPTHRRTIPRMARPTVQRRR